MVLKIVALGSTGDPAAKMNSFLQGPFAARESWHCAAVAVPQ
jgi:hypothetical protein